MSDREALSRTLRDVYARFTALVATIRPELHRYCSRMTGSALDGEDLVQEVLAQACYRLPQVGDEVALRPLLFTIAHHRCVDFIRSRSASPIVDAKEAQDTTPGQELDAEDRILASEAFAGLILTLPPKERSAMILKDLLGYSLPEIAEILQTSVGGVKSAIHRGRGKVVAAVEASPERPPRPSPQVARYLEVFNRRDWPALLALLEEEVRCDLVGFVHHEGREVLERNYLATYACLSFEWKLVPALVDGEAAIVCLKRESGAWSPRHAVRLSFRGDRVAAIRDYAHVPYVLDSAQIVFIAPPEDTT
jgi:RNA polymerase sigma factor (sigma-70 family)